MKNRKGPNLAGTTADPLGLLLATAALFARYQDRHLQQKGFTLAQAQLLIELCGATSPLTKLAQRLGCTPSNMTSLADRLERIGLLQRSRDQEDRRVVYLALTARGREVADMMCHELKAVAADLAKVWTADEATRVMAVLQKLLPVSAAS